MARGIIAGRTARGPGQDIKDRIGRRVFKVGVRRLAREAFKRLYRDVVEYALSGNQSFSGPKGLLYYVDEFKKMLDNVRRQRGEAGKRTPPKTPPVFITVRFVMPDGSVRGDKNAPCIVDLRRGELRIPSYNIRIPLAHTARALIEENKLSPRPNFVLMITRRGFLRLIASRAPPRRQSDKLLLVCMDENLGHGLYTTLIHFDGEKVKVTRGPTFKPPNATLLRRIAAQLQSAADRGATVELAEIIKKAYEELGEERCGVEGGSIVPPDRARELYRRARAREKRLNEEWRNRVVAWLRRTVRENAEASVVVLIDEVTIKTAQSGMLRRVSKRLRNLCLYEGAEYKPLRGSGKLCPRCGVKGVEVARRIFKCPKCGLEWHRDRMATFALALRYAELTENEALYRALLEWLNEHPRALLS